MRRIKGLLTPPKAASSVSWSLIGGAVWVLLAWGGNQIIRIAAGKQLEGIKMGHVVAGMIWLLIGLYSTWAWRPARKKAKWHRWLLAVLFVLYPSGMLLYFGILLWNILLSPTWSRVMSVVMAFSYFMVWTIPALFPSLSKRLMSVHHYMDILLLRWGGIGVVGLVAILAANFGLKGADARLWILDILATILPVVWSQYAASALWPYRPWTKEEE